MSKNVVSDRVAHPEHYRDYPPRIEWRSKDVAWCHMVQDYLPRLDERFEALKDSLSSKFYEALSKDLGRLALGIQNCEFIDPSRIHIIQLLFHRIRVAVVTAEQQKAQTEMDPSGLL